MTDRLAAAVEALFRAPLKEFVAERTRLAIELKASGDKQAATKLSQLARPSVSAWAVNQLWWRQRRAFEALLQAAQQVKAGDREASKQHREALAELRQQATALLEEAGNAASEGTLRRILAPDRTTQLKVRWWAEVRATDNEHATALGQSALRGRNVRWDITPN